MSGSWSSGRATFGGRPRRRLLWSTLPLSSSWPPHTPHGSRRSSAPSRHCAITGHRAQSCLARAMSCSSSEKKSPVIVPAWSLQRASAHQSRLVSSSPSGSWRSYSCARATSPCPPFLVSGCGCGVVGGSGVGGRKRRKAAGVSRRPLGGLASRLGMCLWRELREVPGGAVLAVEHHEGGRLGNGALGPGGGPGGCRNRPR